MFGKKAIQEKMVQKEEIGPSEFDYRFFYPPLNRVLDQRRLIAYFTNLVYAKNEQEIAIFANDFRNFVLGAFYETTTFADVNDRHYNVKNAQFSFSKKLVRQLDAKEFFGERQIDIVYDLLNQIGFFVIRRDNYFLMASRLHNKKQEFSKISVTAAWIFKLRNYNFPIRKKFFEARKNKKKIV
jgi:hypothetical protein